MRAFSRSDRLNHLLRATEPFLNVIGIRPERLTVSCAATRASEKPASSADKANLIDANARPTLVPEIFFKALGEISSLRIRSP